MKDKSGWLIPKILKYKYMVKLSVVAVNKYKLTGINLTTIFYIFLLYR